MMENFNNWLPTIFDLILVLLGYIVRIVQEWLRSSRPAGRFLEGITKQAEPLNIFVRDLFVAEGTRVLVNEPRRGIFEIRNVRQFLPQVEGIGIANIFNVLGQVGKTENIEIIPMGQDDGKWNSHLILLGAQAQKHFEFYRLMHKVAYRMDGENIFNNVTGEVINRENGYGYGIILKAHNPYMVGNENGIALLLGGFGVLGTQAATTYFKNYYLKLGKEFSKDYFGIVVRAPVVAGIEAVERVKELDVRFPRNSWKIEFRRFIRMCIYYFDKALKKIEYPKETNSSTSFTGQVTDQATVISPTESPNDQSRPAVPPSGVDYNDPLGNQESEFPPHFSSLETSGSPGGQEVEDYTEDSSQDTPSP